jgi:3-oxoacid CoA-transferase subunit B
MEHVTRTGGKRLVHHCSLPLTGLGCVDRIITDRAVIDVTPGGLTLREIAPGNSVKEIQELTEPRLIIPDDVREISLGERA